LPDVAVTLAGSRIGFAGRVKAELAEPYHAKKPVWMAEINLDALLAYSRESSPRCAPLPVFPPVRRDITFIAGAGVSAGAIMKAVTSLQLPLLADVGLVDCFEPQNGKERHLTYRLTFRHESRTLKDAEADKQRDAVADAVQKVLPVRV
jgi:phenylalanyl-tRNA synthetase beta chain